MNRFKTAAAAFLVASFVGLQPAAALADGTQRRDDDQRDRELGVRAAGADPLVALRK